MYSSELTTLVSALETERDMRSRFGMDTSLLDALLSRAEALSQLDSSILASMVDAAQSLVGDQREALVAQLDVLNTLG